jgi:hypothetical protein
MAYTRWGCGFSCRARLFRAASRANKRELLTRFHTFRASKRKLLKGGGKRYRTETPMTKIERLARTYLCRE